MTHPRVRPQAERGIALISAILFVLLGSVLVASMMTIASGERQISSNVHTARRALLAADAGARTMEQQITNVARAKLDSLVAISGGGTIIPNPNALFNGLAFNLSCTRPAFSANATVTFVDDTITTNSQAFEYRYVINANGQSGAEGQRAVLATGRLRLSAERGTFSDYLLYTNHHTAPGGGSIWFTSRTSFNGRVHTNDQLRFAYQPRFGDAVSSVASTAWYYNNNNPTRQLNADRNGSIDVPVFSGGFQRGIPSVALPTNAYGQMNAALGLSPLSTTAPANSTTNTQLGLGAGMLPPADGVYLPTSGGAVTGGLFVQGSLDDALLSIDASGRQVYVLRQGSTTDSVIVDRAAGRTYFREGSAAWANYNGVPRGILYATGSIQTLRGPDRASGDIVPAIAHDTKLLIATQNDIIVRRDLVCQDFEQATNVLGLYSAGGSVRIGTGAPNDMNLDAFVLAAGSNGIFGVDNYNDGTIRGTFHLRGGMVSEYYGAFGQFSGTNATSGFGREFNYDRRGIDPPYYPSTGRFQANLPSTDRESWIES